MDLSLVVQIIDNSFVAQWLGVVITQGAIKECKCTRVAAVASQTCSSIRIIVIM